MKDTTEQNEKAGGRNSYEDVHVTLADGRSIYWPKDDMTRLAPAAVCQVMQRVVELRAWIAQAESQGPVDTKLKHIARPLPGEDAWLSGNSLRVHNELKEIGGTALGLAGVDEEESRPLTAEENVAIADYIDEIFDGYKEAPPADAPAKDAGGADAYERLSVLLNRTRMGEVGKGMFITHEELEELASIAESLRSSTCCQSS